MRRVSGGRKCPERAREAPQPASSFHGRRVIFSKPKQFLHWVPWESNSQCLGWTNLSAAGASAICCFHHLDPHGSWKVWRLVIMYNYVAVCALVSPKVAIHVFLRTCLYYAASIWQNLYSGLVLYTYFSSCFIVFHPILRTRHFSVVSASRCWKKILHWKRSVSKWSETFLAWRSDGSLIWSRWRERVVKAKAACQWVDGANAAQGATITILINIANMKHEQVLKSLYILKKAGWIPFRGFRRLDPFGQATSPSSTTDAFSALSRSLKGRNWLKMRRGIWALK